MASMLSLVDCLPHHESVDIGGNKNIDIFGISGEDLGAILGRYPDAFQQMAKAGTKVTDVNQGLLGAMMAAGQRDDDGNSLLGNDKVEKLARGYPIGTQLKIMQVVGRLTFPDGVGPFLEGLVSVSAAAKEAMEVVVRVASKEQGTASPQMRRPSVAPATRASGG
jgi:hypothetical protein